MPTRQRPRSPEAPLSANAIARLLVLAITLVGFAARAWHLGAKSLWLDEGLTISFASRPLGEVIRVMIAEDIHPPLSYLILHFWMLVGGGSELAVRFPALVSGTLLIPATYLLAAALFGGRADLTPPAPLPHGGRGEGLAALSSAQAAALLGALLVAVSPFLVNYAQEARMYSDLALWTVLSSLALWRALGGGGQAPALPGEASGGQAPALPRGTRAGSPFPRGEGGRGVRSVPWLVAYALFTAAALYTQYFAALVVGFQALYVALVTLAGVRRVAPPPFPRGEGGSGRLGLSPLPTFILGGALAGLVYLPWLPGALSQLRRLATTPDFWKGELTFGFIVERVFTAFALGTSGVSAQSLPLLALAGLLFAGGLVVVLVRVARGRRADLYALLYLIVPLVALYAIAAKNPKFTERYLIMIAPIFYLVFARAVVALGEIGGWLASRLRTSPPTPSPAGRGGLIPPSPAGKGGRGVRSVPIIASRLLAGLLALAVVGASAAELRRVYAGPGYEKDDNRAAAAYIQANERPGDAIVLMMDSSHVFKYYYEGKLRYDGLHPSDDANHAADRLTKLLAGKERVWLLLWQEDWADPGYYARDMVDSRLTLLEDHGEFRGLKLKLYAVPKSETPIKFTARLDPRRPVAVNFEDKLAFLGYDPPATPVVAGETADLGLYWQAKRALDDDFVVSVRLVAGGFTWARHDARPAAETYATTYWKPDRTVWGRLALPVPPGTPPGEYDIELVVYPRETKRDLTVLNADGRPIAPRATIGKLAVARPDEPADPTKLGARNPLDRAFGDDLRLVGADVDDGASVRPGAALDLVLHWQALGATRGDDVVRLSLVDAAGQSATLAEGRPVGGRYPTSEWASGEVVTDRYRLIVPPTTGPGEAKLTLSVARPSDGRTLPTADGDALTLATLKVGERPRIGELPTDIGHPLKVKVGDVGTLVGYTLPSERVKPGGELPLTLYWRADAPAAGGIPTSYVVFTQLLDAESKVWGQHDSPPANGANPTTGWLAGEYVKDEHRLAVKPDAPPGEYLLQIGLYDPGTGARLPVSGPAGVADGDRILLGKVEVR